MVSSTVTTWPGEHRSSSSMKITIRSKSLVSVISATNSLNRRSNSSSVEGASCVDTTVNVWPAIAASTDRSPEPTMTAGMPLRSALENAT